MPSLLELTGESWPAELEAFLMRGLDPEPRNRPANAVVALQAWNSVVAACAGFSLPVVAPNADPTESDDPETDLYERG